MFEYAFMRKAFFVGILLGTVVPMMGIVVVSRRTSTMGDALSHVSLAGVAVGLLLGIAPVFGSLIACILGALSIEGVRRRFPGNGDLATAIVLSAGIGLASVLSDLIPQSARLEDFLFGSILAIPLKELLLTAVVSIVVAVAFLRNQYRLLYMNLDPVGARLAGIPTRRLSTLFTVLLAATIAVASRTVGVLMVSSLMVLPIASAMALTTSYRRFALASVLFGLFFVLAGLVLSMWIGLKPGGTIVLTGVCSFLLSLFCSALRLRWKRRNGKEEA